MNKITIDEVEIRYNTFSIKIKDSYKITDEDEMIEILMKFKTKTNYETKRSLCSWLEEWKSHNRLYKLHLFTKQTKDCDLEENIKLYAKIIYSIIGI